MPPHGRVHPQVLALRWDGQLRRRSRRAEVSLRRREQVPDTQPQWHKHDRDRHIHGDIGCGRLHRDLLFSEEEVQPKRRANGSVGRPAESGAVTRAVERTKDEERDTRRSAYVHVERKQVNKWLC